MMPRKTTKNSAHRGIADLQTECKAILQKLTVAHQDWVKNAEKAVTKIKAQWAKADKAMKTAKAKKGALKAKVTGKKTAAHKNKVDVLNSAFGHAKTVAHTLKKELSSLMPELKAAKAALKQHLAVEKAVSKKIAAKKPSGVKAKTKKAARNVMRAPRRSKKAEAVAAD